MQLILITCSDRKQTGGQANVAYKTELAGMISEKGLNRLSEARRELAHRTKNSPGPDLGDPSAPLQLLLPALQRYTGKVYETANMRDLYPKAQKNCRIIILSALYGLLDPEDPIRKYNLQMKSSLLGRQSVHSFWKDRGLGRLLYEYIVAIKPSAIHDLLTKDYRQALEPWPPHLSGYIPYDFPGMGMGALFARGRILHQLLHECAA
jgi:cytoplasmic iron level regulating protein YaaA (DUF328/UPF0246 family)